MATIKEVAKLAGVSIGTVSNVLNGKTSNADRPGGKCDEPVVVSSRRECAEPEKHKEQTDRGADAGDLPVGPCTFSFPTGKSSPGAGVWDLAENQQQ